MNSKKTFVAVLLTFGLILLIGMGGYGLYALGMKRAMRSTELTATSSVAPGATQALAAAGPLSVAQGEEATRRHISAGLKAGDTDPANGRKILYYQDPMVPGSKFDKPAKSPFMNMMLVPVYANGDSDQGKVTISARIQQNLGVRTAAVTEGTLTPQLAAVGFIAFNERDQVIVQARATAYVERLHVRATLDHVAKGQPLVDLYVPDWVAAQEEFLALRRMPGPGLDSLVDGARQRMRQAGMSDAQIQTVEANGQTRTRITLAAPISGVVTELLAREGMTVMPGATLFRINGLSTVWANAEVPESQAALLRPGARVQAKSAAAPDTTFGGKVQAILPDVNPATRTLKARMELANPGNRLVPGMFVQMQFMDQRTENMLLIPTEAVIQTGKRSVVMLVVSSQFLIDSEASLKGVEARLNNASNPAAANSAARHQGQARVEAISADALTLSHGPIPSLKWSPMTMDFKRPPPDALPRNLKIGDRVSFEFYTDAAGPPQLTRVSPLALEKTAGGSQ